LFSGVLLCLAVLPKGERKLEAKPQKISPTRKMVAMAMLAAVSFVLMLVSHMVPKISGFLQFDLKDIPIIIGGFIYGPLASAGISVAVSLLEMVTISTSGPIGLVMNVLASCSLACAAAFIYKRRPSLKGAVAGLVAGILTMTCVMLLWNWLLVPLYTPAVSRQQVVGMLLPIFLPFNLVKGGINAALTMLVYKPMVTAMRRTGFAPGTRAAKDIQPAPGGGKNRGFRINTGVMLASLVALASGVLLLLALLKVI
jgi:riboflavin transporter FmnP